MSNSSYDSSNTYLKDQINKQYKQSYQTPKSIPLRADFLIEPLESLSTERLIALEKLILYKTMNQIHAALEMKFLSVYELCLFFLHRTLRFNGDYHPVISLNPDCLNEAIKWDEKLSKDLPLNGLMGIPIWLKDNIATTDKMPTTGGAAGLFACYPKQDAPIAAAIKKSGAIILGKTNLSEWANFMSSTSSNGYSVLGGQTQNPYGPFDVGGSSSGSAVAIALGLSPIAVGTETCGSLVYPASQNSIVTYKPTHGSLCSDGILPIAASFDTAGPMALTVKDTYTLFCQMGGRLQSNMEPHFYHLGHKKRKVGLVMSPALTSEYRDEDLEILYSIKAELIAQGVDVMSISIPEAVFTLPILQALHEEFEPCLENYFDFIQYPTTLNQLIEFNDEDRLARAPFGQDLLLTSRSTPSCIASETTKEMIEMAQNAIQSNMKSHGFDVLYNLSNNLAVLHAISGYPAITVPAGFRANGEPIGVTFISTPDKEKNLFEIAHLYEETTGHWTAPPL